MSPTNRLQNLSIISLYQTPQKKDEFHYMLVPSRLPNRTPKYEEKKTYGSELGVTIFNTGLELHLSEFIIPARIINEFSARIIKLQRKTSEFRS